MGMGNGSGAGIVMFYLAAGDGEETFWIQLLVLVILAAGVGVVGIIKKHGGRYGSARSFARHIFNGLVRRGQDLAKWRVRRMSELRQAFVTAIRRTQTKLGLIFNPGTPNPEMKTIQSNTLQTGRFIQPAKRGERDFNSGMELLTSDFLVEVVERTGSIEMRDVTMRNLCFTELVRRGELAALSSDALKAYTLDTECVFDKSIRCQAMKELAYRTEQKIRDY
jgi:hypothetical protein